MASSEASRQYCLSVVCPDVVLGSDHVFAGLFRFISTGATGTDWSTSELNIPSLNSKNQMITETFSCRELSKVFPKAFDDLAADTLPQNADETAALLSYFWELSDGVGGRTTTTQSCIKSNPLKAVRLCTVQEVAAAAQSICRKEANSKPDMIDIATYNAKLWSRMQAKLKSQYHHRHQSRLFSAYRLCNLADAHHDKLRLSLLLRQEHLLKPEWYVWAYDFLKFVCKGYVIPGVKNNDLTAYRHTREELRALRAPTSSDDASSGASCDVAKQCKLLRRQEFLRRQIEHDFNSMLRQIQGHPARLTKNQYDINITARQHIGTYMHKQHVMAYYFGDELEGTADNQGWHKAWFFTSNSPSAQQPPPPPPHRCSPTARCQAV